ncbi:MAG: type II toxin-antitoxin system RelE/ParE family toxin [Peptococcaceae bacterium]|nr:type II toxin-antitoxin system RelE/ParE family toxin [Peptococcaceae bacterium]MBQ6852667.1 type II toxin-antitoxin system RelE/ParE family toxin [Peptococcaceae bacterium]
MLELRFTPIAVNDLQKIQQFIAEDSVAMAEKVIQEFFKQFEVLIDFPYMGNTLAKRVSFRTNYKYIVVGNYIVLYRVSENYLEIYRVINRYQDFTKIFE